MQPCLASISCVTKAHYMLIQTLLANIDRCSRVAYNRIQDFIGRMCRRININDVPFHICFAFIGCGIQAEVLRIHEIVVRIDRYFEAEDARIWALPAAKKRNIKVTAFGFRPFSQALAIALNINIQTQTICFAIFTMIICLPILLARGLDPSY